MSSKSRGPAISPSLFAGGRVPAPAAEPDEARRGQSGSRPAATSRPTKTTRRRTSAPRTTSAKAPAAPRRRYTRLHLYVSPEAIEQVKTLQGEALIAGVPMGARGPSVVMAAALDVLRELSPGRRIEAIRRHT